MLKAGLDVANRGRLLNGTMWFELQSERMAGSQFGALAGVVLGLVSAIASGPDLRTDVRRAPQRVTLPVFAAVVLAVWALANGAPFLWWVGENESDL